MSNQKLRSKSPVRSKQRKTPVRPKSPKKSGDQKRKAPVRAKPAKQAASQKTRALPRPRSVKPAVVPSVVEAQSFSLKDKKGNVRAVLGLDPEGKPGFLFFDPRGQKRVAVGMANDGSCGLWLYNTANKPDAFLMLSENGSPILGLSSALGTHFIVSLESNGLSAISLANQSIGSATLMLNHQADGAMLNIQTKDRTANIALSATQADGGRLRMLQEGKLRTEVGATGIVVADGTGGRRSWPERPQAGTGQDGQPNPPMESEQTATDRMVPAQEHPPAENQEAPRRLR